MERARRTNSEPLRARPQPLRIEFRLRSRNRRQSLRGGGRQRNRRLGSLSCLSQRTCRRQAHARLISRSGIIPIAHSQDTAGPMARTVRDAAFY